jgi:hypothetical protein
MTKVMTLVIDSANETITINGIRVSLELLESLTVSEPQIVYRFRRQGNDLIVDKYEVHATPATPLQ